MHTAPGHGLDDFIVGQRYGLPVTNPVGNDGRFLPDTPLVAGLKVEERSPSHRGAAGAQAGWPITRPTATAIRIAGVTTRR